MILSFSRNFAFVAVPRTGTHAVRSFLRPLLAPNDWEQCTRYERRLFPVAALTALGHGHISAKEIQPFLLPGQWKRLFTFGFVRDPMDRFLSAFYFLRRDRPIDEIPAEEMKQALGNPERRGHLLMRPQASFLCDADGKLMVDFAGRYERFGRDLGEIARRIGAAAGEPGIVNASQRPRHAPVDDELRDMVRHVYADDYRLLQGLARDAALT